MKKDLINLENCNKIAIMGGTFDPIHYGHLVAANIVSQEFDIDKVIFMPTGKPAHKANSDVSSVEHRYLMTVLATLNNEKFNVSRLEIDREGLTYTIDTINYIKTIIPDHIQIYFITGADAIAQFSSWKDAKKLAKLCQFIAVTRPKHSITNKFKESLEILKNNIYFVEIPALEISSTDIRDRVKKNKTISYLLPRNVEKYIFKTGLYKNENYEEKYKHIIDKLKDNLNINRFNHTLEVAKQAVELAKIYRIDEEKAFLAGVLHDCAKCFSEEKKLSLCEKYKIKLNDAMKAQVDLAHSFLGYFIARDDYGIKDEEILDAIKYHTTGNENMTELEKIVYISDYIEPTRKPFDAQLKAREIAYKNLDDAMREILKNTIDFNLSRNRIIHPLSTVALEFYNTKEK